MTRSPRPRRLLGPTLGALGVVYGDIGTSPLYAIRECFHGAHAIQATSANVLGVLSLVFWSLVLVISIKYLLFVMRADNEGEGGILALIALLDRSGSATSRYAPVLTLLGLFGAALLYGDGMITPAISVLSAVEGLRIATPVFEPFLIPITVAILMGLFALQRYGTGTVGAIFGPVTLLWFAMLAIVGARSILLHPVVLEAVNPWFAADFFVRNQWDGFLVLGTVFLVVTGGEALYADMGHFGRRPIRLAWFVVVLPALLLNYFGQGALLIANPAAREQPFFLLMPTWALYPAVALATTATVIASQAVISGAFSMTRQAVQLGYSPRLSVGHTSAHAMGQVYVPSVNWALMLATIGLVVGFRSSSNLASAYGVAVTTTMVITGILLFVVARDVWGWHPVVAALPIGVFLTIDLAFFGASLLKILHGGWFPLVVAAVICVGMSTWKRGRQLIWQAMRRGETLNAFVKRLAADPPLRVPGTAVFMVSDPDHVPQALAHLVTHAKTLHEQVVFLTIQTQDVPRVTRSHRLIVEALGQGLHRVIARYGFMEHPDVTRVLARCTDHGLDVDPAAATYFLGRESLVLGQRGGMARWRRRLFILIARNANTAADFFRLPGDRVVEIGVRLEL